MTSNDNIIFTVTDQASGADEGEGHLFEKLFESLKGGLEGVDDLSIGEMFAVQCLIVNGITQTLGQIAQVQMSQNTEAFTDIKKQMAIAEFQKHLFTLDGKLKIITEVIDGKMVQA